MSGFNNNYTPLLPPPPPVGLMDLLDFSEDLSDGDTDTNYTPLPPPLPPLLHVHDRLQRLPPQSPPRSLGWDSFFNDDDILAVDLDTTPIPGPFIPGSLPRFAARDGDGSKSTRDEQNKALKKLRKEIYNPAPPKRSLTKRVSLYYSGNNAENRFSHNKREIEDEDGKGCAICLDDFEPKQVVMVTPCNHMFHEECIVPWVKSHGQCPLCRFAICK